MKNTFRTNNCARVCFRPIIFFGSVILLLLVISTAFGKEELGLLTTEDLITQLTEESNQGIGSHTTALATGFVATDDTPRFQGGVLGSKKPAVSPVMRELVRRGLDALPLLINHLTDVRPTKLTVGDGFTGKWFADEYDGRDHLPKKPGEVNGNIEIQFERYTLRVGDFCYVAVGQIVNRELNAVRYQPSLCLVVNSPVGFPALAAAVKSDWGGLSEKDHRLTLEKDAVTPQSVFAPGAGLKRLMFYYPESGEERMLKLLERPFYDHRNALDFFEESLVKSDVREWEGLMSRFQSENGETGSLGVLKWTLHALNFPESQMTPERRKSKEAAAKVLEHFFRDVDPNKPPFINAVGLSEQRSLLDDLAGIQSKPLDDAVLTILRKVSVQPPADNPDERFSQCDLAFICAKRLDDQSGHGGQARELLGHMIAAFEKARKSQDAEGRTAFDKNIRYLRDALVATKGK